MLGISAAYNVYPCRTKWLLRRLDHSAIYVLIAATYTPFLATTELTMASAGLLAAVWLVAIGGVLLKLLLTGPSRSPVCCPLSSSRLGSRGCLSGHGGAPELDAVADRHRRRALFRRRRVSPMGPPLPECDLARVRAGWRRLSLYGGARLPALTPGASEGAIRCILEGWARGLFAPEGPVTNVVNIDTAPARGRLALAGPIDDQRWSRRWRRTSIHDAESSSHHG